MAQITISVVIEGSLGNIRVKFDKNYPLVKRELLFKANS